MRRSSSQRRQRVLCRRSSRNSSRGNVRTRARRRCRRSRTLHVRASAERSGISSLSWTPSVAPLQLADLKAELKTSGSASSTGDAVQLAGTSPDLNAELNTSGSASSAGDAVQLAGTSHQLLQDIRAFGRIPKEVRGDSAAQVQERHLAERLRKAKQEGLLSAAQKSELADLNAEVKTVGLRPGPLVKVKLRCKLTWTDLQGPEPG